MVDRLAMLMHVAAIDSTNLGVVVGKTGVQIDKTRKTIQSSP